MIRKVIANYRKLDPDSEFRTLLLGVSGGADSMALLHAFAGIRDKLGVELAALHVNHMARGGESDGDAAFVRRACRDLGVKCRVCKVNIAARAKRRKISFEMAAREARYECFAEAARKAGPDSAVVTAHTRDDQAETVLLKLARGAGTRGLAGIPARGTSGGVEVLRPLLDLTREEIVQFLRRKKVTWREDSSNQSSDYLRNRVRQRILPLIEADLNPNAKAVLARTAEVFREDDELLQTLTEEAMETCLASASELNLVELRREHRSLVRRVIMTWLVANGVSSEDVDLGLIASVEKLVVSRKANASMKVSGGIHIVREYDRLCIGKMKHAPIPSFSCKLPVPGRTYLPAAGLAVEAVEGRGVIKERGKPGIYPARATISRKALGRKKLTVRSWKAGDRMKPGGMKGSKKIKDILMDQKVPAAARARVPVVECGGDIVWLPGFRVARDWMVEPGERSVGLTIRET